MKVAITAAGDTLEASIDPRFGRCAFLLLVDSESGDIVGGGPNECASAAGGAGSQTARRVVEAGASAVLTGSIGPNAFDVLAAAGVQVRTGASGSVRGTLETFLRGELNAPDSSTVSRHAGQDRM